MMERMLQQMNSPSTRLQAFEQLRRLVHNQRQQHSRQIQELRAAQAASAPQHHAELSENRDRLRLTVDLPGVLPNDLELSHDHAHGVLTVSYCRKHYSLDGLHVHKKQKVSRRYAVNTAVVDTERLTATLAHGVLTIEAPKKKIKRQQMVEAPKEGLISVAASAEEAHPIQVLATAASAMDPVEPPPPPNVSTSKASNMISPTNIPNDEVESS